MDTTVGTRLNTPDYNMSRYQQLEERVAELEKQNEALRKSLKNYADRKTFDKLWRK